MAETPKAPGDLELLADLQKLTQAPVPQGGEQSEVTQLLVAAQIDALCLGFERQRNEVLQRKREVEKEINTIFYTTPAANIRDVLKRTQESMQEQLKRLDPKIHDALTIAEVKRVCSIRSEDIRGFNARIDEVENELATITQRIARYRAIADRILNGLEPKK